MDGAADALESIFPERLGLPARLACGERSVRVGGEEHLPAMARGEEPPGPVRARGQQSPSRLSTSPTSIAIRTSSGPA